MRKQVALFSLLFAWLCANGALLDGVQVFAWAKMFAGYARTMPAADALRETFDPAKPCEMCTGVAAAKDVAKKQIPQSVERSAEKIVLALQATPNVILVRVASEWPVMTELAAPSRCEPVPVPPPRA